MLGGDLEDHLETFDRGDVLFEEGDWGNTIFLVKEGEIEILRDEDGKEFLVSVVGPGQMLGEMTMLRDESERTATARARTTVECYKFLDRQMDELLRDHENFRRKLLSILTSRLHDTTAKWSTAESKQDLLYVGAIVGLKMYHLLSDKENPEIDLTEDLLEISDTLSLDRESLETMINNPGLEELHSMSREQRDELTEFAGDALETVQSRISFRPPSVQPDETEVAVGGDPAEILDDLLRLKRVNTQLETHEENDYEDLEREEFKTFWAMFNELERLIEAVDPDHLPQPELLDQLKSETSTLKTHLDQSDFDGEDFTDSS